MITGIKIEFNENDNNYFETEFNADIDYNLLIISLLEMINDICKKYKLDTNQQLQKYIYMGSVDNYTSELDKIKMEEYKTYKESE